MKCVHCPQWEAKPMNLGELNAMASDHVRTEEHLKHDNWKSKEWHLKRKS